MSNFIYKDQTNILKTKSNPCYTKICKIKCSVLSLYLYIQYTPSVSTIKHSGPTYSTQNVRQMSDKFESQHSLSPTIWSDILVGHFGRT